MFRKQLTSNRIDKITNIIHIADIHIRNFKRHDEYQVVFNKLYEYCREQLTKEPNTIIYLAGDIVHAKTDLSPELVEMTRNFFVSLSEIAPVILISGNHDCVTADHEILTKSGWIQIADYINLGRTDSVATFDSKNRTIQFSIPTDKIKKQYSGKMIHLESNGIDLVATPTHRVPHYYRSNDTLAVKNAEDIHTNNYIPVNGIVPNFVEDPYAKLLGFAFADSTFVSHNNIPKRIQFHFKKDRKIQYLQNLLTELQYVFNTNLQKNGTTVISIYSELARKIYSFFNGVKQLQWDILNNDLNFLKSFINGYLAGDGSISSLKSNTQFYSFSNIDKQSIEILQTIIHMTGGVSHCNFSGSDTGNYENSKLQYRGNCSFIDGIKTTKVKTITHEDFNDFVYCLEVPSSYLLIRRNGKIFVTGNCNLNNRSRMDALSPIVNTIDASDFHYLEESGIYTLFNVDFILNSVYDDPENFIVSSDVTSDNIKIVLYHGTIDKAKTDLGVDMKNSRVPIEKFDGFDFGMFGDIHRFQYLDSNGKFAYAGSLIQQNFGEGLQHGIINWNIETRKSKFITIKNDWEYHTIDIKNGVIQSVPADYAAKNRIRLRSYDTSNSDLSKAIAKLKSVIPIEDIRIQKISTKNSGVSPFQVINIGDIRDAEYQNDIIVRYLEEKHSILDDIILDQIRNINRRINTSIGHNMAMRNIIWTPIRFEFENMFSYGSDNFIDFNSMSGTYGMFAANASGKSSFIDALLFCIFDKCSKTFKATKILNTKKDSFKCKLQFQIAGTDYFIERTGVKDKKGHVKVDVNFWCEKNGVITSLNGDDRSGTNFIIRDYLGTYDDFIITAASLQNNNTNFVDTDQRDRKDLLAQFLDLDVFEELNQVATDEMKEIQVLVKDINKQDYPTKMADASNNNKLYKDQLLEAVNRRESLQSEAEERTNQILDLTKKIKSTDFDSNGLTPDDLYKKRDDLDKEISDLMDRNRELNTSLSNKTFSFTGSLEVFSKIDKELLFEDKKKYDNLQNRKNKVETAIHNIQLSIEHNQSKIDKLKTHEYDPNCKFCVENVFVIDAKQAETELIELASNLNMVRRELLSIDTQITELNFNPDSIDGYYEYEKNILEKQRELYAIENSINHNNNQQLILETKYSKIEDTISKYEQNITAIEDNKLLNEKISNMEIIRDETILQLRKAESDIVAITSNITVNDKIIFDCADAINKLKSLELEQIAYSLYLKAVNRNGVPYDMISNALPKIQTEVNSILSQIVDFQILFDTDGKSINAYIVYDDTSSWDLELTSGMEKFISSLAIRTALINVSSLPRPNFIIIDEGLGALDSSVLSNFSVFLEYMKTEFDFLILVSHIDTVKDIVDSQIDIKKENGTSNIQF